jgi:hypothetical protein
MFDQTTIEELRRKLIDQEHSKMFEGDSLVQHDSEIF